MIWCRPLKRLLMTCRRWGISCSKWIKDYAVGNGTRLTCHGHCNSWSLVKKKNWTYIHINAVVPGFCFSNVLVMFHDFDRCHILQLIDPRTVGLSAYATVPHIWRLNLVKWCLKTVKWDFQRNCSSTPGWLMGWGCWKICGCSPNDRHQSTLNLVFLYFKTSTLQKKAQTPIKNGTFSYQA